MWKLLPQVCVRTSGVWCLVKNIGLMELMAHSAEAVFWPQISNSALSTLFVVTHQRVWMDQNECLQFPLLKSCVCRWKTSVTHTLPVSLSSHNAHWWVFTHTHTCSRAAASDFFTQETTATTWVQPEGVAQAGLGLELLPWWQRSPGVDFEWINFYPSQKGNSVKVTVKVT